MRRVVPIITIWPFLDPVLFFSMYQICSIFMSVRNILTAIFENFEAPTRSNDVSKTCVNEKPAPHCTFRNVGIM